MTSSIFQRLRAETRELHERVERVVPAMTVRTLDEYEDLLRRFHSLFSAIEPRILGLEGLHEVIPDLEDRQKLPLLRRDLRCLGSSPLAGGALPATLPLLDGVPSALGCLYVVEGSTLGGRIIRTHLERHLGLTRHNGASFFSSYGDEVGPMWARFRSAAQKYLVGLPDEPGAPTRRADAEDSVVRAAIETFVAFERWFSLPPAAPSRF